MKKDIEEIAENAVALLIRDANGIYIPQLYAQELLGNKAILAQLSGSLADDLRYLAKEGPESEWYWEAWDNVLNEMAYEIAGISFSIHQNGDLWQINDTYLGSLTEEEQESFWNNFN